MAVPESRLLIKPLEQYEEIVNLEPSCITEFAQMKGVTSLYFSKKCLSLQPSNYGICLFITFYQNLFMQIMHIIVLYISIKKIIKTNNYFVLIGFWKINC